MNKLNLIILIGLMFVVSIPASATITHRYNFVADANDVVGGLESTLVGGAVVADGSLVLNGTDQWLEMDAAGTAINTYSEASMEAWYTPVSGGNTGFTMLACFGSNVAGNLTTAGSIGVNYWFMTSARGDDVSRGGICTNNTTDPWATETAVNGTEYDDGLPHHMVATVNSTQVSFFLDGEFLGTAALSANNKLADVSTAFAMLGKGTYNNDPEWNGSINEFRIYDKALSAAEMRFTEHFGPDDAYPIALHSMTPADGTQQVSTTPTLSWTPESWVSESATYNLYVGRDPNIADPNVADVSNISDLIVPLAATSYTVPVASRLAYFTNYYWRVDTVDGPGYQGVGMSFKTVPEVPSFSDDPVATYVFEGDTAEFTGVSDSVSAFTTIKWFKEGFGEVTDADADVTINTTIDSTAEGYTATSTLTIANTDATDMGSYYMEATNIAGSTQSAIVGLLFKELLAYWPFDNDLVDATGNGWDGTTMSTTTSSGIAPIFATGEAGQAIDLDGTQTYVDLPDGLADDFSGGLTFSVWAYPRTVANWARFLSFNNGSDSDNIFFARIGTDTTLRFQVYRGSSSAGGLLDAANALVLNVWQMFTVTMSPTGEAALYKNGRQVATGTVQTPNVIARTNNWIGRSAWPDALYNGLLDDIRIYNYALTPEDVASLYTSTTPEDDWICVSNTDPALGTDVNGDCQVNIADIAALASLWLECERVPTDACSW